MSEQAPQRQISLCYQNFIVRPTVLLDGFHNKRSNRCHICQVTSVHFLQTGGKLLILYLWLKGGRSFNTPSFFPVRVRRFIKGLDHRRGDHRGGRAGV